MTDILVRIVFYKKRQKNKMKKFFPILAIFLAGCGTLMNDAMIPISFATSTGETAECIFTNKRGVWKENIPSTVMIRRSDDNLNIQCETEDGRKGIGSMESLMGAEIVASAVFIDFGITDAITDKHRRYDSSYIVSIPAKQ
jgi:hypothetical protein